VDVATGRVSCAALRDKRAWTVLAALRRLQQGLPFKMLDLHSDSGSEFLNSTLIEYCADQHITFTRGRAYRKNDGCFVEQINRGCRLAFGGLPAPGGASSSPHWSVCTTSLATTSTSCTRFAN
jgi:hypothetical protein